jgi:hypothetical protein
MVLATALIARDARAQRVRDEIVELSSGDRVTGEVKGLDRSYLTVRTVDLGMVQVRWQRVVRLNSNRTLEVELAGGRRVQGSIVSPAPGMAAITGSAGTLTVDLPSIVRMRPVERGWVGDLTGRVDFGFSYTRGSGVAQTAANSEITTRRPAFESTIAFSAVLTKVEDQTESSRYFLGYNYYRFRTGRVFIAGLADAQRNRDLGIAFRASVGAGPGYRLLKTQRQEITVVGGPLLVREVPVDGTPDTHGFGLLAANYSVFLNEYPRTELDVSNQLRFGLSDPGRFLLELNASARRELWRDFYLAATVYDSYDNRPPPSSTLKNDVGVTVTLGWTF